MSNSGKQRTFWIRMTAAVLLSVPAPSRAEVMDTFLEWQQKYQNFLKENGRPLFEPYQKKLLDLEKSAVAARNYALAAKIKAERLAAAKELGLTTPDPTPALASSPVSTTGHLEEDGSVTLEATLAELGGGVSLNAETGALAGWSSDKSFARWKLPSGLKTGGYEVELTYSCGGAEGGGSFVVKEDTFSLRRDAKDSGSWQSFRPDVCGTLRVKSSSQQLLLSATTVKGAGLCQLKQVRLRPVSPSSSS